MPRLPLATLACLALLLPVGGCYRYDARAKNLTSHDVRVSIHKGSRQREVSTAMIGPGASVGWTGSFNGPVLMRVAQGGLAIDVDLPRRAHTEVQVSGQSGSWSLIKTVGDESYSIGLDAISLTGEDTTPAEEATEPTTDAGAEMGDETGEEMIDLVEPGDG